MNALPVEQEFASKRVLRAAVTSGGKAGLDRALITGLVDPGSLIVADGSPRKKARAQSTGVDRLDPEKNTRSLANTGNTRSSRTYTNQTAAGRG